jgi:hypothetical protein
MSHRVVRSGVVAVAATTLAALGAPGVAFADDVNVSPSSAGMPGGELFQRLLAWLAQGALWGSVASILLGGGIWGLSKVTGNYDGGSKGLKLTVGGVAGALLVGVAPQLVNMAFQAA